MIALLFLFGIAQAAQPVPLSSPHPGGAAMQLLPQDIPVEWNKDAVPWSSVSLGNWDHQLTIGCGGVIRLNGKIIGKDRAIGKELCDQIK